MRKILNIAAVLVFLAVLNGCVKDSTVTDLKKLNTIAISGIADTVVAQVDDTLSINPVLGSSLHDTSHLSYLWYAYNTTMQLAADTLSKQKNMAVPVALPPGFYTLIYMVTDNNTGVFYKSTTTLSIVNAYTTGIMILTQNNGSADLDFLNTSTSTFIPGVYAKSNNGGVLGKNPVSVYYFPQNFSMPAQVVLLCQDARGGVFLNPVTMVKQRAFDSAFYVPLVFSDTVNSQAYVSRTTGGGLQDYVVINGQAYNRSFNSGDVLFKPPMLGPSGTADYYASNQTFNLGANLPTFYDDLNRRFLGHNAVFQGYLSTFTANASDSIIDPNHVGLNIVYAATGNGDYFGLFQDTLTAQRYILRMVMAPNVLNFTAEARYAINAPYIQNASAFASSYLSSAFDVLFYAYGSQIYAYNVLSQAGGLLYDLGSGYSIDCIKFSQQNPSELRVAYRNANLAGQKGGFIRMNISTIGGLNATPIGAPVEGFCDKIVDFADKY